MKTSGPSAEDVDETPDNSDGSYTLNRVYVLRNWKF